MKRHDHNTAVAQQELFGLHLDKFLHGKPLNSRDVPEIVTQVRKAKRLPGQHMPWRCHSAAKWGVSRSESSKGQQRFELGYDLRVWLVNGACVSSAVV